MIRFPEGTIFRVLEIQIRGDFGSLIVLEQDLPFTLEPYPDLFRFTSRRLLVDELEACESPLTPWFLEAYREDPSGA